MRYELLGAFLGPRDELSLIPKDGRPVLLEQGGGPRENPHTLWAAGDDDVYRCVGEVGLISEEPEAPLTEQDFRDFLDLTGGES